MNSDRISRRLLLKRAAALGLVAAVEHLVPARAWTSTYSISGSPAPLSGEIIDLTIGEQLFCLDGRTGTAMTINGTIPGPIIRLKEGQRVTLRVTNRLQEDTSIHWHGILLPPEMDGVPGVSFGGIEPGTTFTYRFPADGSGGRGVAGSFLADAENALRSRPKDEEALREEQIKKLKEKIGDLVLDNDILREAYDPYGETI
jgi:hypothetical protein